MKDEVQFQSKEDKLAETLKKSGFAFSQAQAKSMAQSISKTEFRVQDHFETKKASSLANHIIAGSQNGRNYFEENKARLIQNALNPQPLNVQVYYDTPKSLQTPQEKKNRERETSLDLVNDFKQREEGERYYKQFGSSPKQHDRLHAEPEKQHQQQAIPQINPIVEEAKPQIIIVEEQIEQAPMTTIIEAVQEQTQPTQVVIEPKIELEIKTPEIMTNVNVDEKKEFILEVYEADKKNQPIQTVEINIETPIENKPHDRIETIPPVHTTTIDVSKTGLEVYHDHHEEQPPIMVAKPVQQPNIQSVNAENFFNFAKKESDAKKTVSIPNLPPMARQTEIPRGSAPQAQHVQKLPNVDIGSYFNFGNKSAQGNNGLKLAQPKTSPAPAPRPAMPSVDLGAYFNYNKNKGR